MTPGNNNRIKVWYTRCINISTKYDLSIRYLEGGGNYISLKGMDDDEYFNSQVFLVFVFLTDGRCLLQWP